MFVDNPKSTNVDREQYRLRIYFIVCNPKDNYHLKLAYISVYAGKPVKKPKIRETK